MSKVRLPVLALGLVVGLAFAPEACVGQIVIRGQIVDANSQRAVPYVNVMLKDRPVGVSSDAAGRFVLSVPEATAVVVFRHINYEVLELSADALLRTPQVYLQPRVIPLPAVEVQAPRERLAATADLPLATARILRQQFDLRGFVDAGDLLHTVQSVQVDEVLSGRKRVSIRGGNADDVAILYHGVKLNSGFDNTFDLSLLDLADVEQVELIKGSNAALLGAEAFSGVINLVPRLEEDHNVRFFQRVGTYDSGTWGLAGYGRRGSARLAGIYRASAATRHLQGSVAPRDRLENSGQQLTVHGRYGFSPATAGEGENLLLALYLNARADYANMPTGEALGQRNQLLAFHYNGPIGALHGLDLTAAHHALEQTQEIAEVSSALRRTVQDRALHLHVQKKWSFGGGDATIAYQREQDWLDFADRRESLATPSSRQETAALVRTRHGGVAIARFRLPGGSERLERVDFDVALRHDHVYDRWQVAMVGQSLSLGTFTYSTIRFGSRFAGRHGQFAYGVFMNIGNNVRFPSLAQLISRARLPGQSERLAPERNRGMELGLNVARDMGVGPLAHGWEMAISYFQNDYTEKIREYVTVGMPLAFYDSVPTARIAGFEGRAALYLLRKKLTVEGQACQYFISERAAFPFHSEATRSLAAELHHAGYAVRVRWFAEGEQEGWIRDGSGGMAQLILPARTDLDLHASKTWQLWRVRLSLSVSLRNLLNDRVVLEGLALRDRRYYLTAAVEY
ncbi:MAG: TonB-dependent receptor [bacterium]|nr:TonB-dependent receptor [candidate division KSB1 bacterium]MDH7561703.1 TonB-dependent receptor [bacterium]